jgi:hypothetical protein
VLEVALTSKVTSSGFKALTNLHHLEQFIFGEFMPEKDRRVLECEFLELCPRFLPQLKVAGRRFDFLEMDAIYNNGFKCNQGYHNSMLQNFHQTAVLGLILLNLRQDYLPNENIQFPDLKELILWNPSSGAISVCDRFASVCALGLQSCGNFDVLPVLRHVGHRLHSLVLDDVQRLFTFGEVFRLCPDLKRFKVSASNVDEAPEQLSDAAFWCMEEIFIASVILPSGFLKQVYICALKNKNWV